MAKRTLHDKYFKLAKREGYLARSAYKLIEIDDRRKLIRRGDTVLDLGCAPGSWMQVASQRVGPNGRVVGIDLLPVGGSIAPNVRTIIGDFTQTPASVLLGIPESDEQTPKRRLANVVLSDMVPNTSGHGDHFISTRLCEMILDALPGLLRPGGSLAMKVFEGETFGDLVSRTKTMFHDVKVIKPKATRDISSEVYVTAKRFHLPREEKPAEPGLDQLGPDESGRADSRPSGGEA